MNSQVALTLGALLLIIVIFTAVQSSIRTRFLRALDNQRGSFLRALHEMQPARPTGPDTGGVPITTPPTGPKNPTGGRPVRKPTHLP